MTDRKVERIPQGEYRRSQSNAINLECRVEFDNYRESRELDECVKQMYGEDLSDKRESNGKGTCQE